MTERSLSSAKHSTLTAASDTPLGESVCDGREERRRGRGRREIGGDRGRGGNEINEEEETGNEDEERDLIAGETSQLVTKISR